MNLVPLAHSECVKLIRTPERRREALISINGCSPVAMPCFMVDNGDLLFSSGEVPAIFHGAAFQPVTVEFLHIDRYEPGGWTITGTGIAYPMTYSNHLTNLAVRKARAGSFEDGLRIRIARFTGYRTTVEPVIPRQRDDGATPVERSFGLTWAGDKSPSPEGRTPTAGHGTSTVASGHCRRRRRRDR
ncbi:hypothetical protein H074_18423 [Amycolatopsis decaplanina DSM 44594]|uniref:Uncharacterized protein n=1 Tax=Amycolatopsis decaplanina DSM 44594 TaxID=1284240 RepID=M2YUM2_9PSEU|nr:hypothetical protein H074_18423 [Amycolatopsis decaplanina DSM 44594]